MTWDTKAETVGKVSSSDLVAKPSLLARFRQILSGIPSSDRITPGSTPLTLSGNVWVSRRAEPFKLMLGTVILEFHPDLPITGSEKGSSMEWIIHPGCAFYETVPKFIRIRPGEALVLGRSDDLQTIVFGFDTSVADRHVKVFNRKGDLIFQPLEPELPTSISGIDRSTAVWKARRDNLLRLPGVIGCGLEQLESEQALDMIREVNAIIASEAYRTLDDDGEPGGIIQFPGDMTVVILGDVHARADNVLRVLTEGGMLTALENEEACLVFLGDVVHSQESDELEDMRSSVFILDLFCMLKRRFPKNIFYVHGNHESFSADVGKRGVLQGLLFQRYLKKLRGKAYVAEVEKLFDGLAFVVQGSDFAACHGAPVRSRVNLNVLVNIRRYPGIQSELVWNRLRQGNRPSGYSKGSVKRFRKTLNLPKHAPLIVGHTPLSDEETLWLNVGGIEGHHIVYSAHTHRMATIVMSGGYAIPLEYVPEPALDFFRDAVSLDVPD
ncbi:MAG: metallophosphoesterase [Anderseniella sp.]